MARLEARGDYRPAVPRRACEDDRYLAPGRSGCWAGTAPNHPATVSREYPVLPVPLCATRWPRSPHSRQHAQLDIAEPHPAAVLLQPDMSLRRLPVIRPRVELAVGHTLLPIGAA